MKKIVLMISAILLLGTCLVAQGITGRGSNEDYGDAEVFEANKTKTEVTMDSMNSYERRIVHESYSKVFINDVPLEIKQIVRWTGSQELFYNASTDMYTLNADSVTEEGIWKTFKYNEDIGYVYTDFVYPGELVSNIGENICSI